MAEHSPKEPYRLCKKDCETEEEARAQQKAAEPLMNEWMNSTFLGLRNKVGLMSAIGGEQTRHFALLLNF
jgi:hypothetical protein